MVSVSSFKRVFSKSNVCLGGISAGGCDCGLIYNGFS